TYPSYALNLAQLGALCISNLCATKPVFSVGFSSAFFIHPLNTSGTTIKPRIVLFINYTLT
ncbi:hypothetical protein KTI39_16480, partial [Acinetobacter baumannii]|nr:hypothetical protein [Acinetobacter baumannii]